jgi:UDP-GlcNAc:undecaprenyl-phosphate GlcNAc-1-phosphate transferase
MLVDPSLSLRIAAHGMHLGWLLAGALLIVAIGVADDLWNLPPSSKLLGESIAALLAFVGGFHLSMLEHPLTGERVMLGALTFPFTLLWMLIVTNAFNVIDGLDGLATGVALIAALAIWGIASLAGRGDLGLAAAILAGALVGFLWHNFHPASIFLGDSGSLLLGYVLSIVSVEASRRNTAEVQFFAPLVLLGVPLTDLLLAAARRFLRPFRQSTQTMGLTRLCLLGMRTMLQPDRHHIHHRLLARGFSHRQSVLVLYVAAILCGGAAVLLLFFP